MRAGGVITSAVVATALVVGAVGVIAAEREAASSPTLQRPLPTPAATTTAAPATTIAPRSPTRPPTTQPAAQQRVRPSRVTRPQVTLPATPSPTAVMPPTTLPPTTTTLPPTTTTLPPTTTTLPPTTTTTAAPVVAPPEASAGIGSIEIPKIGLTRTVSEGIELSTLDNGPGHWPGTAMPGELGNAVFAGHRVSNNADFRNLDALSPGDEVIFNTASGRHVYTVVGTEIVQPEAIWIVDQTADATATLFACHPPGSISQRIVTHLRLVG